jgi:CubicO group peptidase (beta-lactamase class C family)
LNSGKIIPLQVLETAYKPYKSGYGFGLNIDSVSGKRHISHGGGIHGFVSMLSYIPQDEVSVAIIVNAPFSLGRVEKDVLAILYNQPYKVAEAPKEIKVDSSGLTQYVGEYELAPTFKITITLANGRLKAQATGQQAFEIYPKEKNIFFYKTGGFFTKNN